MQGLACRKAERCQGRRCLETSKLDYGQENYSGLCNLNEQGTQSRQPHEVIFFTHLDIEIFQK